MYSIGIDVGGTFTDLVLMGPNNQTVFAKSPSTPEDQSIGVLAGLGELARLIGLSTEALLSNTGRIVHGTTVATNALLEKKGARVALLTTQGHRDVLEMREGLKGNRYDLLTPPPAPLVPRNLRFGVQERIDAKGEICTPLDCDSLREAIKQIKADGNVQAVAICYLHSYKNPLHEIETEKILQEDLEGVYISRSSDVWPQIKEFERVSTTVVNSYVGPAVKKYLQRLEARLSEASFRGSLFIILSHGGIAPVEEAWRLAAATVLSGPAGGIAGVRRCAELIGADNLAPFDMGGTSTDISLIVNGAPMLTDNSSLGGERIALRSLDIASIAAGGGSIAWVDRGGVLRVGPESAGSKPGPASYGLGGKAATVTDANVALGLLGGERFMGGRRKLDHGAARVALEKLADKLQVSTIEVAAGIYRLVNLNMADGIRLMTLRRGVDPRKFTMVSFGGAAGVHAVEVARELEIRKVLVPVAASVLSAWGMLSTDLMYEIAQTNIASEYDPHGSASIREVFDTLKDQVLEKMQSWHQGPVMIKRSADMRYGEQIYEIEVEVREEDLEQGDLLSNLKERFHARHEELYTYASRDQEVVFVNARVSAIGSVDRIGEQEKQMVSADAPSNIGTRTLFLPEKCEVPLYDFAALTPGQSVVGPCLIESDTTTVLVGKGDTLRANQYGWLEIAVAPQSPTHQ